MEKKAQAIVITGASSGIGKALYNYYKDWYDIQYNVIGVSRHGPDVHVDVTKDFDYDRVGMPNYGCIKLLINCAGIMPLVEDGKEQEIMDTNFWGTHNMIKKCLHRFINGSCVINIASISATNPDEHQPIYAASKAAMVAITKSMAKRYAKDGIRFNCISPGFYDTNLVEGDTPQELIDTIPVGYEEEPEKLAELTLLIWTTQYMTGSNIVVDGGLTL